MNPKSLFRLLTAILLMTTSAATAQQPTKLIRIGYLAIFGLSPERVEAFRQGLRELSYAEGKNLVIEYRHAAGQFDRLPALAAELVRLKVDVIVTSGSDATRAAKEATSTIPIVMAQDPDPIGNGFIASLARPGGNITGLSNMNRELSGKRLELLKETFPKVSRVAVLGTSTFPGNAQNIKEAELAAKGYKVTLQYYDVLDPKGIQSAFRAAANKRAQAVLPLGGPVLNSYRTEVVELAAKNRLPAMYIIREYVEAGGLMSYGVNITDLDRRAASYVDKILQGRTPADLPVEQPMKFEFIVNLKAAKRIAVTIPPNVLVRADKVIR